VAGKQTAMRSASEEAAMRVVDIVLMMMKVSKDRFDCKNLAQFAPSAIR
jgi:hypothetical protein